MQAFALLIFTYSMHTSRLHPANISCANAIAVHIHHTRSFIAFTFNPQTTYMHYVLLKLSPSNYYNMLASML